MSKSRPALKIDAIPVSSKRLFDDAANYDAFLTLLEVIDMARTRLWDILSMIAAANTLAIDLLPFGHDDVGKIERSMPIISKAEQDHIQWLHSNLNRTKYFLGVAMGYFQSLYGDSFFRTNAGASRDDVKD
jgi:hypothetical protein